MDSTFRKINAVSWIGIVSIVILLFSIGNAQKLPRSKSATQIRAVQQKLDELRKHGFQLIQKQEWTLAKSEFESALEISPNDPLSLYGISLALFNLRQYLESEKFLEIGIKKTTGSKQNLQTFADCLVLSSVISAIRNDSFSAIGKLEKAIKTVPNHFDGNFSLGRAYFGNGDIDKSVASFKRATLIQPQNSKARFFLATALERSGNTIEALSQYRKVIEISPNSAEGHLGVGVFLIKTEGDKSLEGLQSLQKAVELNANLYEAQITLGKTLIKLNRADESVNHLQIAAKLAPNNPEPHFQLAIAYRKLGMKNEAEAENEIVKRIHENRRGGSRRQNF